MARGYAACTRQVAHPNAKPVTSPAPARAENPGPAAPAPGAREVWIGRVGSVLLRLLAMTLRIRVEDPEHLRNCLADRPLIFVFWHNRLLLIPVVWNRFLGRNRPRGAGMISLSRDGESIARILNYFGLDAIRGSANRKGSSALRECARLLKAGRDVGITPDGSRGPLYVIKPGLVLLAQLTGNAILPISFEYSRAWRLGSWDRFFIPKPFSTVIFRAGTPCKVARTTDEAAFEQERLRCERAMMEIVGKR